jgi:PleD family two-component response regulator
MAEMDGFETAALIRQRRSSEHTPIIFLTAFEQAELDMARGYSLGAVDYIFSPIVPEVLRAKAAVFVELYQKTAEVRELYATAQESSRSKSEFLNMAAGPGGAEGPAARGQPDDGWRRDAGAGPGGR